MSILVSFPSAGGQTGTNYTVPEPGDTYTQSLTDYLVAIGSKALGVPTSADLDLGAAFGVKSIYFKSRTANPAQSGILRLAAADTISWRNQANGADVALGIDAGNALTWGGANITGNPMLYATTSAGQSIANNTLTIVVFGTVTRDSDSAYNSGTGRFTVPTGKGGDYLITASIYWNAAPGAGSNLGVYVGGIEQQTVGQMANAAGSTSISLIINLAAGAIVDIRTKQVSGGAVILNVAGTLNFFTLKRIPT